MVHVEAEEADLMGGPSLNPAAHMDHMLLLWSMGAGGG